MKKNFVIKTDSMGEVKVPASALYGAQTQRAVNNFPISNEEMPKEFITALALVKAAATQANARLKLLPKNIAKVITEVALNINQGKHLDQFPVDVFQTGSGTSSNMNMNEVIATLATKKLKKNIDPNDHVNMGQSSNDVIPTTIHVAAALEINNNLLPQLKKLATCLKQKASKSEKLIKTGRTHLMDAMPLSFAQEFSGYEMQINKSHTRIINSLQHLLMLAQGGTAIGTGINTDPRFAKLFTKSLKNYTKLNFVPNKNFFESIASQDTAVEVSGQLKTLAVSIMKIANDLRWMNSGPLAGFSEIQLTALQPGSSIMPGKVNPVIPEAITMVCVQVIGNDTTITIAGQSGNFQLNVMLPVIAKNLLESIKLLAASIPLLIETINTLKINKQQIQLALSKNPILVTALNPIIGYQKAAQIAKTAYAKNKPIIEVAEKMTKIPRKKLEKLLNPAQLAKGGIK